MTENINKDQILFLGSFGMLLLAFSIVLFIYLYQRKLIKKNLENQEIQDLLQNQEMKTTYALLEGQDKERKRIAAELHDNLGSILSSLNMFADALQTQKSQVQIEQIVSKISDTARLANEEVRRISHSLDAGLLKHFGLKTAILQLMEAVESSKKMTVETEIQIDEQLTNERGLEVYRMIQEMVNNALKHAKCTKIRIDLTLIEGEMNVIFHDNGVGFDLAKVENGLGLKNIGNRVAKLEGSLSIESIPGKGSTFIIEIPNL